MSHQSVSHPFAALAIASAAMALGGCSIIETDKIDYRSATSGPSLDVPPDLTQLSDNARYVAPKGVVSASGMQRAAQTVSTTTQVAVDRVGDVRYERQGNDRWLVVARDADTIWPSLRDFWADNGFVLTTDQPAMGIMETDWAENRAKIPQDFIRRSIGKVFDNLYSSGERDRFRTRVERRPDGGTEIHITHRGMEEVYADTQKSSTTWRPRATDPELETEFLRRMMQKLGGAEIAAKAESQQKAAAPAPSAQAAAAPSYAKEVPGPGGASALELSDGFDRAWRRVGVALDRAGFTVEDRDRTAGAYFVRYVAPGTKADEPGFFGKLFGRGSTAIRPDKYRVLVRANEAQAQSLVTVVAGDDKPADAAQAGRILKALQAELQ